MTRHLVPHLLLLQTEGSEAAPGSTTDGMSQVHLVIWGTDVNVQDTKYKFAEFLQTFVDDLPEGDADAPAASVEPFYMACMEEVGDCLPFGWVPARVHLFQAYTSTSFTRSIL